jgi:hypothetical protein
MGKAGITPQQQLLIFGLEILELIVPISTIIGLAATTCTTTSLLPQVIKAHGVAGPHATCLPDVRVARYRKLALSAL